MGKPLNRPLFAVLIGVFAESVRAIYLWEKRCSPDATRCGARPPSPTVSRKQDPEGRPAARASPWFKTCYRRPYPAPLLLRPPLPGTPLHSAKLFGSGRFCTGKASGHRQVNGKVELGRILRDCR